MTDETLSECRLNVERALVERVTALLQVEAPAAPVKERVSESVDPKFQVTPSTSLFGTSERAYS